MQDILEAYGSVLGCLKRYAEYRRTLGMEHVFRRSSLVLGAFLEDSLPRLKKMRLQVLEREVASCKCCALHKSRSNTVFGQGALDARLMFVGEGPGSEEDLRGEPFVGAAGQLLTRIIHAIGLKREEVYIANVVKCRPPGNRTPLPEEIEACRRYLLEQIRIIGPRILCALGAVAAQALLSTDKKISALRGRFHRMGRILVMPTYHPSFLLRNPEKKRETWEDMQKIQKELEKP